MGSGSYKNSYGELRHHFLRSEILVNTCWPFGQQPVALLGHITCKKWLLPNLKIQKYAFFLVNKRFLSPEMGYRSYNNSYKELRHHFSRSEILVNMCWPFGQHWVALLSHISAKMAFGHMWKSAFSYIYKAMGVYTWYEATIL